MGETLPLRRDRHSSTNRARAAARRFYSDSLTDKMQFSPGNPQPLRAWEIFSGDGYQRQEDAHMDGGDFSALLV